MNAAVHLLPPAEALRHIEVLTTVREIAAAKDETLLAVHLRNIITRQAAMKELRKLDDLCQKDLKAIQLPNPISYPGQTTEEKRMEEEG